MNSQVTTLKAEVERLTAENGRLTAERDSLAAILFGMTGLFGRADESRVASLIKAIRKDLNGWLDPSRADARMRISKKVLGAKRYASTAE